MRRTGLILFGTGLSGFLMGGSGLDGSASTVCVILTAVSFLVAAVGYGLWKKSEYEISLIEFEELRKEREVEATEEIITHAKETTFQMWLTAGKLDV